jgi:hypothetical protein
MTIRVNDDQMTLDIDGTIIATARQAGEYPAVSGTSTHLKCRSEPKPDERQRRRDRRWAASLVPVHRRPCGHVLKRRPGRLLAGR